MKSQSLKNSCLSALFTFLVITLSNAQEGNVVVHQDEAITELLKMKKQINSEDEDTNRYKIQIYSGNSDRADGTENRFDKTFNSWLSKKVYETPNYKIWVGNFRTRLEADKALMKIKTKFPNAFIFKPKSKSKKK